MGYNGLGEKKERRLLSFFTMAFSEPLFFLLLGAAALYVVIGAYGKGIYIYKDGEIKSFPLDKNLFLQYAHCFVRDNLGYVWISTNRGLFKASSADMIRAFETNTSFVYYHYVGKSGGMEMTELNGGCSPCGLTLQDGTLSFPSMGGLLWVRPNFNQPLMPGVSSLGKH